MLKYTFLNGFIERMNTYQLIIKAPFLELYNDWFTESRFQVENEILENILLLPNEKSDYLKYAKKRIQEDIVFKEDNQFLKSWVKEYDLRGLEFPFIEDEKVKLILSTSIQQPDLSYNFKKTCSNMQQDFYCYAALIEKINILKFIDDLIDKSAKSLKNEAINGEISTIFKETSNVDWYPKIFKDENSYDFFMRLYKEFGDTKENLVNYSFVYHKMTRDGLIHPDIKQIAYYNFLSTLDISIDRIKSEAEIGKIPYKENIYKECE